MNERYAHTRDGRMRAPRRTGQLVFAADQDFPPEVVDSVTALYLTWSKWIWRRTERVRFIDLETLKRESRWELELPAGVPGIGDSGLTLIPIGLFSRGTPLVNLEVRDDSGSEAFLLTREEGLKLESAMKRRLLELDPGGVGEGGPRNFASRSFERETAGAYLQVAVVSDPALRRRSLSLSYEEQMRPTSQLRGLGDGAKPADLMTAVKAATADPLAPGQLAVLMPFWFGGDCASTTVELEAPEALEVADLRLYAGDEEKPKEVGSAIGTRARLHLARGRVSNESSRPAKAPVPTARGQRNLIRLTLSARGELERFCRGLAWAALVLLAVTALAIVISGDSVDRGILATVVAFTAGIATSLLIKPGEHEIEGRLLIPVRARLAVVGAVPIVGALTLALDTSPATAVILLALLALAVIAVESLGARFIGSGSVPGVRPEEAKVVMTAQGERSPIGNLDGDVISDDALVLAAREFADRAGWALDEQ